MKETAKRFDKIAEGLPRICPIEDVINYDYGINSDWESYIWNWESYIEGINCKIDLYNEKYYPHRYDKNYEHQLASSHPQISKYSVWISANFGSNNDNQYFKLDQVQKNLISTHPMSKETKKKFEEDYNDQIFDRLQICDYRILWVIDDKILFDYINQLTRDEFINRFNKDLCNYVKRKVQIVKSQGRSAKNSKWQIILDEILDWFAEKNLSYNKVQPLFEINIVQEKKLGGRPPGKSKIKILKEDKIMELYEVYIRKDIGEQTKKEAAEKIRTFLLTNKPNWWKGNIYKESTIYKVLKTLPK